MNPALADALAGLCPGPADTWLLRACLQEGSAWQHAWNETLAHHPDLWALSRDGIHDCRRLSPLLFDALRRNRAEAGRRLLTVLRTATLREELRSREYSRICAALCSRLGEAGIPFIVFRGAALGETVYAHPVLRHSHDINVLIERGARMSAVEALAPEGFAPRSGARAADASILDHTSGLPALLHTRLFQTSYYGADWDVLWARTSVGMVAGCQVRLLAPVDALLHACCRMFESRRPHPVVWACDAHLLMRKHAEMDWERLAESAARGRTELPAYQALSYLAGALDSPVPEEVLAGLRRSAGLTDPVARDIALLSLRQRRSLGGGLPRAPVGWRDKLTRARWLLLPSPGYLQWAYGIKHPSLIPFYYPRRVARYLVRELRVRMTRLMRRRAPEATQGPRRLRTPARVPP